MPCTVAGGGSTELGWLEHSGSTLQTFSCLRPIGIRHRAPLADGLQALKTDPSAAGICRNQSIILP